MNSSKIRHVVTRIVLLFHMTLVENEKMQPKTLFLFMILHGFMLRVQGMVSWVLESSKWALQNLYSKNLYEIKEFELLVFIIVWYQ